MSAKLNIDAEKTAQNLHTLSTIHPDKRILLRKIVKSAPANLTQENRLNDYFSHDIDEVVNSSPNKLPIMRVVLPMALVFIVLLGGIFWLGSQNNASLNTSIQQSQVSANGKVSNAVNAITQQAQAELQTVQTANIETVNLDAVNNQLGQMQEVTNEKF